jgi:hypothetical protein
MLASNEAKKNRLSTGTSLDMRKREYTLRLNTAQRESRSQSAAKRQLQSGTAGTAAAAALVNNNWSAGILNCGLHCLTDRSGRTRYRQK